MTIESEQTAPASVLAVAPGLPTARLRIPALVWRNSILLMAAQAFVGTGQQMVPTLGAIMAVHLTGAAALAGLASSMLGLTRVLASYPSGKLADTYGHKALLVLGILLTLVGAIGLGSSSAFASFPLFVGALFLFGVGNGAAQQQQRLSAVDLYPPQLRARGLGFVLSGSLIGALGGPVLIHAAEVLHRTHGVDQVSASWFLVPALLVPSLVLVLFIRPDPKQIALALERYYPGYRAADPRSGPTLSGRQISLWTFLRNYPQLVAFLCMFVLYANMSMMMALTPITMTAKGLPLSAISLTVAVHVLGMFAFSLPIGALTDSLGRQRALFLGIGLSTVGTVLVALTVSYPLIMLGLFLIGLGWSCGNVATAALVADTTPPHIRGRAMGANASFSAAASVAAPLLGGLIVQFFGAPSLVIFTLIFIVPTAVLLARLRETSPGVYEHASDW